MTRRRARAFITQPRHIEIQVLADKHGNCIYLGDEQAVALAQAVDY